MASFPVQVTQNEKNIFTQLRHLPSQKDNKPLQTSKFQKQKILKWQEQARR